MNVAFFLKDGAVRKCATRETEFFWDVLRLPGKERNHGCSCAHVYIHAEEIAKAVPVEHLGDVDDAVSHAVCAWDDLKVHVQWGDMAPYVWLVNNDLVPFNPTAGRELQLSWDLSLWNSAARLADPDLELDEPPPPPEQVFEQALIASIGGGFRLPRGPIPIMVEGEADDAVAFDFLTLGLS